MPRAEHGYFFFPSRLPAAHNTSLLPTVSVTYVGVPLRGTWDSLEVRSDDMLTSESHWARSGGTRRSGSMWKGGGEEVALGVHDLLVGK